MAYYLLGTSLVDGNEDSTWNAICTKGLGVDQSDADKGFRLYVDKEKFRSATVDTLIGLTDALQKLDLNLEGVIKKIEKQHKELDTTWEPKISTNAGDSMGFYMRSIRKNNNIVDVIKYMRDFMWEDSKFPRSKTLPELVHLLQDKIIHLDNDIKKQITEYTDSKNALATLNKKQEGGLMTKDLTEIFMEKGLTQDAFPSSRLLTTLVAIVGKYESAGGGEKHQN